MNIAVTKPTFQDASNALSLKTSVDKTMLVNTLSEIKNTGTITKEQFKNISKGIEGGDKAFSEVLKTIMPESDLKKLKDSSISRIFTSNKDIKVSIDSGKLGAVNEGFEKIINKTKDTGEKFSNSLNVIKNSIDKLKNNGDEVSKTGFIEANVSASLGASNTVEDSLISNVIGLTNTELGVSAGAKVGGSVSVSARNVDGKIKLDIEGKFSVGGEVNAQAKIAGAGSGVNSGLEKSFIKK